MTEAGKQFMTMLEGLIAIHKAYGKEIDKAYQPYVRLYEKLKKGVVVPKEEIEPDSIVRGKMKFENDNEFVMEEIDKRDEDDFGYTVRTILFAPAYQMADFKEKLMFSEYLCVIDYKGLEDDTDAFLFKALFDRKIANELVYIGKKNNIHIREDFLEKIKEIEYERLHVGELETASEDDDVVDNDDLFKKIPVYVYRIKYRFSLGVKLKEASALTEECFGLWHRIREEFAEALGLY